MVVPGGRPRGRVPALVIVVCWKWVAADGDERWAGVSDADRAALEVGLRLAEASGDTVTVVTVGEPGAEHGLREALAVGAAPGRPRRRAPPGWPAPRSPRRSPPVAAGADWVLCGDASADRGSGSVPAFLAAELGAAQALGLVAVTTVGGDRAGDAAARRRPPGGPRRRRRRRCCRSRAPSPDCGGRRSPAELAARTAPIDVVDGPARPDRGRPSRRARTGRGPGRWRRRPAAPSTGCAGSPTPAGGGPPTSVVTLDPPAAAERILAALARVGLSLTSPVRVRAPSCRWWRGSRPRRCAPAASASANRCPTTGVSRPFAASSSAIRSRGSRPPKRFIIAGPIDHDASRPRAARSADVKPVISPDDQPNRMIRPPAPRSSNAARPAAPPTPSSTTVGERSPSCSRTTSGQPSTS